ncbi:hypothetical protein DAPPUDRAFT_101004 [Daphnia pulex]|uniref:Uncharacterized protein n=1 Tax=Daphnia pulex TaxID=6669 RepID=E9GBY0_DAPPU|nr:hypothetical protein DAPPUDRAFT_101004 [Daphnia pulex]|eukprot:EFX83074.1 hypothetical protein DAPPUDRAFT_101004 [Daphnia pulex]
MGKIKNESHAHVIQSQNVNVTVIQMKELDGDCRTVPHIMSKYCWKKPPPPRAHFGVNKITPSMIFIGHSNLPSPVVNRNYIQKSSQHVRRFKWRLDCRAPGRFQILLIHTERMRENKKMAADVDLQGCSTSCILLHPDELIVKVRDHLQLNFPFFGHYSCSFEVGRIFMKTKCRICVIRACSLSSRVEMIQCATWRM